MSDDPREFWKQLPEYVWCRAGVAGLGEWEHNNREGGVPYIRADISEHINAIKNSQIEHMAAAHAEWAKSYKARIEELKAEIAELKAEHYVNQTRLGSVLP